MHINKFYEHPPSLSPYVYHGIVEVSSTWGDDLFAKSLVSFEVEPSILEFTNIICYSLTYAYHPLKFIACYNIMFAYIMPMFFKFSYLIFGPWGNMFTYFCRFYMLMLSPIKDKYLLYVPMHQFHT